MKAKLSFCIALVLFTLSTLAQPNMNNTAQFSLITCDPGSDIYSLFGHTAIRINDTISGKDIVFNYGIFDFSSDNFIWKFVKGETFYMLGVQSYNSFMQSYKNENRNVWEQKLMLSDLQKNKLYSLLLNDYKPENRVYLYNFLYNNCATKVRDNLEKVLNISTYPQVHKAKTYRELINEYLANSHWTKLGINLALGKPLDKSVNTRDRLFLPIELMNTFEDLGFKPIKIGNYQVNQSRDSSILPPIFIYSLFIIAFILFLIFKFRLGIILINYSISTVTLIGGIILLLLTLFSIHPAVKPNLNLAFFNPLFALVPLYLTRKKHFKTLNIIIIGIIILIWLLIMVSNQVLIFNIQILYLSISFIVLVQLFTIRRF